MDSKGVPTFIQNLNALLFLAVNGKVKFTLVNLSFNLTYFLAFLFMAHSPKLDT
jgi:hypothetical protein